jgi:hypothetical protein
MCWFYRLLLQCWLVSGVLCQCLTHIAVWFEQQDRSTREPVLVVGIIGCECKRSTMLCQASFVVWQGAS